MFLHSFDANHEAWAPIAAELAAHHRVVLRYFEQITLPATCAPGHEEPAAVVPAKERKSLESTMANDPAAMGSGSGVWDGPPVPMGTMQGDIRVWPAWALAVVEVVRPRRSVPARDRSPVYWALTFAPSCANVRVPDAPPATKLFMPLIWA